MPSHCVLGMDGLYHSKKNGWKFSERKPVCHFGTAKKQLNIFKDAQLLSSWQTPRFSKNKTRKKQPGHKEHAMPICYRNARERLGSRMCLKYVISPMLFVLIRFALMRLLMMCSKFVRGSAKSWPIAHTTQGFHYLLVEWVPNEWVSNSLIQFRIPPYWSVQKRIRNRRMMFQLKGELQQKKSKTSWPQCDRIQLANILHVISKSIEDNAIRLCLPTRQSIMKIEKWRTKAKNKRKLAFVVHCRIL